MSLRSMTIFAVAVLALDVAAHEMGALHTVKQHLGDSSCGSLSEASQDCYIAKIMQLISNSLGCSNTSGALCDELSKWFQILNGTLVPTLTTQEYLLGTTELLIKGYSGAFYGSSDADCEAGCQECCNHTQTHWPGPEANSFMGNAAISARLAEVPAGLASGAITRRNMLGYLLLNDMYWFDLPEGNQGLGLGGQSMEIHQMVRPILDKAVGAAGNWTADGLYASAVKFQASRNSTMAIQGDVKIWTQQVMHEIVYGVELSEAEAQEFVDFQTKVLLTVLVPQGLVDAARSITLGETLLQKALGFDTTKSMKEAYLSKWLPYVKARYGDGLSEDELAIVNSNLMDGLTFAGGLSVPGVIGPGIGALYADDSPAAGITLSASNAEQYAFEATRYFPPVLGFPYVNKSESLPLKIMAVGMGQRAADAWGADAEIPTFQLRDMDTYQKYWVGHADGADNSEVKRSCPGKSLSMAAITAWFKAWQQSSWKPVDTSLTFYDNTPFLLDFTVERINDQPVMLI